MKEEKKRLFFAYEISASWPLDYPKGRLIDPSSRHLTLAFLGDIPYPPLEILLNEFPSPPFRVAPIGFFDACLFLPKKHPHVVAWQIDWQIDWVEISLENFQQAIVNWLKGHGYQIDERPLLSHVTLARTPFDIEEWRQTFVPLPVAIQGIHLYESMGNLTYRPIWSYPLLPPIEELDHTADLAFLIRAESTQQLHLHAAAALAFRFPPLLRYMKKMELKAHLDDIIAALNALIARADSDIGCPLKAVSFHGSLQEEKGTLQWEMIVDV